MIFLLSPTVKFYKEKKQPNEHQFVTKTKKIYLIIKHFNHVFKPVPSCVGFYFFSKYNVYLKKKIVKFKKMKN